MRAMILAAGLGTRLRPLTEKLPKPLLCINHKPLIVHIIESLKKAGITEIVINVHYLSDKIISVLGQGDPFGVTIAYSLETTLLNTGGGVLKALPLLGSDPFVIVSGDIYTAFDFSKLPKTLDYLAHLILTPNPKCNPEGDFVLENGQIYNEGKIKWNYANIGVYAPELFIGCPMAPFCLVSHVLRPAVENQQVSGELFTGKWHNVGTHSELESLNSI